MTAVVLIAVDLARLAILLAVDLLLFLRSQFAAVGLPVVVHFLVDLGLVIFQMCGLTRGQLTTLDALRDAVLLVLLALAHFTLRVGILHRGVVLVLINLFRELILLLIQGGLVGPGQFAVVQFAHVALFLVHGRFFLLQVRGLAGSQFAALHAVGDAVLLVLFAVLNAFAGYRRGRGGGLREDWQRESRQGRAHQGQSECVLHGLSPCVRFLVAGGFGRSGKRNPHCQEMLRIFYVARHE